MTDDKAAPKHQESAKLGVEVSKQFLTLAIAGMGFVIGMLIAEPPKLPPKYFYWALIPLSVSAILGLLFLMGVVNQISKSNNYDIYSSKPRFIAALQILFFAFAVSSLGVATVNIMNREPPGHGGVSVVEIQLGDKHVRQTMSLESEMRIRITNDNEINIDMVPKKR